MNQIDIDILKSKYRFPRVKPDVPVNDMGWFTIRNKDVLNLYITDNTKIVMEIGSWMGKSTRSILNSNNNLIVIAIDHWEGSAEHKEFPEFNKCLPTLYDTFIATNWEYRDRLIPVKLDSISGMVQISNGRIIPDIIYIDASHDYQNVLNDLTVARSLFPTALIIGDDWGMQGVKDAVMHYVKNIEIFELKTYTTCWVLKVKDTKTIKEELNER